MKKVILTPLSESETETLIYEMMKKALAHYEPQQLSTPEPFIKGIHELAKFLRICPARAQKLKNENAFPYWQDGRTVLFDPVLVRQGMMSNKAKS